MHEVEVIYFNNFEFVRRKWDRYQTAEAMDMYNKIITKYCDAKDQIIVTLRDGLGDLLKSDSFNFKFENVKKKKKK